MDAFAIAPEVEFGDDDGAVRGIKVNREVPGRLQKLALDWAVVDFLRKFLIEVDWRRWSRNIIVK